MLIKRIFSGLANNNRTAESAKPKDEPKQADCNSKEIYPKAASDYSRTMFTAGQNITAKADDFSDNDFDLETLTPEEEIQEHDIKVSGFAGSVLEKIYTNCCGEELTIEELAEKDVFSLVTEVEEEEISSFLTLAKEAKGRLEEIASNNPVIFNDEIVELGTQYLNEFIRLLDLGLSK